MVAPGLQASISQDRAMGLQKWTWDEENPSHPDGEPDVVTKTLNTIWSMKLEKKPSLPYLVLLTYFQNTQRSCRHHPSEIFVYRSLSGAKIHGLPKETLEIIPCFGR